MRTNTKQIDDETFERHCREEWDNDPELREEFLSDWQLYYSYAKAVRQGRARIIRRTT